MEAVILFGVILVVLGVAFAVPMGSVRGGGVADRNASVLGASILVLGLGALNFGFVIWFVVTDELEPMTLLFGLAPLVAAGLGTLVVRGVFAGPTRVVALLAASSLTLGGLPGYFAVNVALLIAVIAVLAFVGGFVRNPRSILRMLDPRL